MKKNGKILFIIIMTQKSKTRERRKIKSFALRGDRQGRNNWRRAEKWCSFIKQKVKFSLPLILETVHLQNGSTNQSFDAHIRVSNSKKLEHVIWMILIALKNIFSCKHGFCFLNMRYWITTVARCGNPRCYYILEYVCMQIAMLHCGQAPYKPCKGNIMKDIY